MQQSDLTYKDLAKILDIHQNTMVKYMKKRALPPLLTAKKIEEVTHGLVKIDDLISYYQEK